MGRIKRTFFSPPPHPHRYKPRRPPPWYIWNQASDLDDLTRLQRWKDSDLHQCTWWNQSRHRTDEIKTTSELRNHEKAKTSQQDPRKKMITYFSPSCGLFLELFFCLPQRFLKPSRIVFPLFQHLLLILLKLWNLFDNAISKNRKRKFPLEVP